MSGFTIDTVSFGVVLAYRDGCESANDEEGAWYANRALDQFLSYRLYCQDSADVDALDEVCRRLNDSDAKITAVFRAVGGEQPAKVESYPGRRDWRRAVTGAL